MFKSQDSIGSFTFIVHGGHYNTLLSSLHSTIVGQLTIESPILLPVQNDLPTWKIDLKEAKKNEKTVNILYLFLFFFVKIINKPQFCCLRIGQAIHLIFLPVQNDLPTWKIDLKLLGRSLKKKKHSYYSSILFSVKEQKNVFFLAWKVRW